MAKRQSGATNKIYRQQVLERDGPKCCFCGVETVDYGKKDGILLDDSMTLEHIIALKNGGDNSLSNLRISCYRCNSLREQYSNTIFNKLTYDEFDKILKKTRKRNE